MASQIQINSEPSPTQREFDMDNIPSEYIGIEAPSADLNESARELFGLDTTPVSKDQQYQQQCNSINGSDGPLVPLYTPVTPFYGTLYGYPFPAAGPSPGSMIAVSPQSPFIPQYLPPQYMHYLPDNNTGVVYGPTIGNQMMFGMEYNAPKFVDGDNLEMEILENFSGDRDSRSEEVSENEVFKHKKAPPTPTSHYASGNGHAQKRLCLDDNALVSPAQLANTEGQEVTTDELVEGPIRQKSRTSINDVGVNELSDYEKDHLQQFVPGLIDLENLLKSGQIAFTTSPCTSSENTVGSFVGDNVRSSNVPRFQSLLELDDQNIKCMQDGLHSDLQEGGQFDSSSMIYPQSPLIAEEVIIETCQG